VASGPDPWREEAGEVERLAFFSDAVFAIAMTLLVVELERPQVPEDASARALRDALLDRWPDALSYAVSFLVVGLYWAGHHRLLRWIARADRGLVWRNLLVLLGVAFVPYPTAVLGDYAPNPTAVVFYAATLALVGALWWATWRHAWRAGLLVPGLDPRWAASVSASLLLPPLVFAGSILVAVAGFPEAAMYAWLLLLLVRPLLGRRYRPGT
jgi:uncharacterized membrane protein